MERVAKSVSADVDPEGGISRNRCGFGGRHSVINEDANEPLPGRCHRDGGILHFPGEDSMKDSLDLTDLWEFDPIPFEIHTCNAEVPGMTAPGSSST